jgi:hypothetical protein
VFKPGGVCKVHRRHITSTRTLSDYSHEFEYKRAESWRLVPTDSLAGKQIINVRFVRHDIILGGTLGRVSGSILGFGFVSLMLP